MVSKRRTPKTARKVGRKAGLRMPKKIIVMPQPIFGHSSAIWWSLLLLATLVGCFLLVREILTPFVVGLVLAYMLNPMVTWLTDKGLPRAVAALIPVLIAASGLALALFWLIPLLVDQITTFATRLPMYLSTLERYAIPERLGQVMELNLDPRSILRQLGLLSSKGAALTVQALQQTLSGAVWLFNMLLLIIMTPLVAYYLMMDWPRITEGSLGQLPQRWHAEVMHIMHEIDVKLSAYLRGTFLVCLCMGLYYAVALNLVGPLASWMSGESVPMMELAWAIGFLTGILAFLPVIGASIGAMMMVMVALLQYQLQMWEPYALIFGIFVLGQTLEGYVMTPTLVGNRVGLHPLWVIFALLAGGALAGIAGMLAALPVAVIVSVILPRVLAAWRVRVDAPKVAP